MSRDRKWCKVRNIDLDDPLVNSQPIVDPIATRQPIDAIIETIKARAERISRTPAMVKMRGRGE